MYSYLLTVSTDVLQLSFSFQSEASRHSSNSMRVQSKCLFNFQPKGVYEEDLAALNAADKKLLKDLTGSETVTLKDDMIPEENALVCFSS